VQQTVEETMEALLKRKVFCLGCGRTDAGVHASQFFFHFDHKDELPSHLVFKINKMLPDDIAIHDIFRVEGTPHAQFSAVERTYEYYIHTTKNPYLSEISTFYHLEHPDLKSMQHAANLLLQYHDFSRFCKCPLRVDNVFCQVKSAQLYINESGNRILFRITADRFIAAMNRVIVQRLIDVATGKLSVADFEAILSGKIVPKSIRQAYPQGLHLVKVTYPFLHLPAMGIPQSGQNEYFWHKIEL
jgi:tRNA pseudouridine38-40 synthase